MNMLHKSPYHFLNADDLFQVIMWFTEKFPQPFPATNRSGEIEFMKNRKLLFLVEDGNIVEGLIVYLHAPIP